MGGFNIPPMELGLRFNTMLEQQVFYETAEVNFIVHAKFVKKQPLLTIQYCKWNRIEICERWPKLSVFSPKHFLNKRMPSIGRLLYFPRISSVSLPAENEHLSEYR